MDLFESAGRDAQGRPLSEGAPLAVRMRPRTVDEVLGQDHLLRPGQPLRRLIEPDGRGAPTSVFLWGPPGIGKTTLAYLVARQGEREFVEISAVSAGVKELRDVIHQAKDRLVMGGRETVLFIDEVHRFSKTQQDALLPAVENRWVILIAATTENPSFSVIAPLLSRSLLLTLHPLSEAHISELLSRALSDPRGYGGTRELADDAREAVIRLAGNDARRSLTILEAAAGAGHNPITLEDVEEAVDVYAVRYDRSGDQHYDVISAFIKSIRGSDVDAAIHYLARMLEAGEDPRFIARRLMISAAEDIGMADPSALQTATAAAQSVALVGMPEARIILAEAVVYLATAPKSNRAYQAINAAIADVRSGRIGAVPVHLRDKSVKASRIAAEQTGHDADYLYAHDQPGAIARQQYLPDELKDVRYYEPTQRGFEANITQRLAVINDVLGKE
ncbi:MAG: replication-associated recombination protein A [Actinomycetaceae bacterium]|nr:replication-associated recombination protein A [Arcanobacterium sp.]MDD7686423.1 replication-associated recombination protein A [Actinomycetaceae bacterium]MDY5272703.1 replication-associated recombination protein A [Arcanobacterium sp.]